MPKPFQHEEVDFQAPEHVAKPQKGSGINSPFCGDENKLGQTISQDVEHSLNVNGIESQTPKNSADELLKEISSRETGDCREFPQLRQGAMEEPSERSQITEPGRI